jgi:hypothetical protein
LSRLEPFLKIGVICDGFKVIEILNSLSLRLMRGYCSEEWFKVELIGGEDFKNIFLKYFS